MKVPTFLRLVQGISGLLLFSNLAYSAEVSSFDKREVELEEVVIKEKKIVLPTKQAGETVYTGVEVTKRGMELSGIKGTLNVYEVLSILPGVVFESSDPSNLAAENTNVRIRGIRGYLGGLTVQGIPNYGANPIGPRSYVYDLENFESIAVYKGAIPADFGVGVGNRAGAIELRPAWAKEKTGITLSQSFGSFNFYKSYVRVDTGKLHNLGSRLSAAYSYTESDKWKGPGNLGPRNNLNLTFVQPIGEHLEVKIFANFNEINYDKYRYLDYSQARDLEKHRRLDFNKWLTGNPTQDYLYYKYNKAKHLNRDLFAVIDGKLLENVTLTLKPYYSSEDAKIWDGTSNLQGRPGVQKRTRDIERKGFIGNLNLAINNHFAVIGYHYECADMDIYTENYLIVNGTGALLYRGFGVFATSGKSYIHSPYIKIAGNFGNFNWQAGLKYFKFKDPSSEGFVTNTTTLKLQRAPDLDREAKTYHILLPTVGLSYRLNENIEAYFSYGRNFIRPYAYLPLVSLYNRLRPQFRSAGITLNDLFKGFDIERSDNFDLGFRMHGKFFDITSTLFYSKHRKLLTTISDPRVIDPSTGKPVNYQQNVGRAKGYGVEVAGNLYLRDGLVFYLNPTYNHLTYDKDITYAGKTLKSEGKQVVDVPRWTVASGLILNYNNFEIMPQVRFLSKRYGNVEHTERIPSFLVCDLRVSYLRERIGFIKNFKVSVEVDNLFDKKYISVINAMDDAVSETTYGVGAPFTVRGSLSFRF
ncbi:MAG: TonB-dependent receptor [Caldimicrobium sp.]|jgi:iron complex outermembrane receptor protein|nr:TonB-dependent receptor [Caldimicrobium sp.]